VKEIVVLSGRVGADKTSLVGFLATLARSKVLAAYDVDTAGRIAWYGG
jgi:MinD superfamily P-loop ATPase